MKYTPHTYQDHATQHIIDNPASGLFLEMGLGKTVATLTAIDRLMHDELSVSRVLVIAPKMVAENTWTTEASKWDHLRHLRISRVLGSEKQRKQALLQKADIYVINRENVVWLIAHYAGAWPFDMVVVDELSSFKSAKSQRFKALRMVRPKVERITGLTGTPAPNDLIDLWSQLYLLDQGQRLGKTLTGYRDKYFIPGKRNGHIVYEYNLKTAKGDDLLGEDIYKQEIYDKISDICISMKAEDWLDLPERINRTVDIHLSPDIQQKYREFERDQVLALEEAEVTALNAAALTGKLLQYANGAVYNAEKQWHEVHKAKLDALEEIVESANGNPVLVFYWFQHDIERIMDHLRAYKPVKLNGAKEMEAWNAKKISLLLAHPQSAGHGLNMQAGGNIIVWFSPIWSLELYQQANARLDRQGQTRSVIVHHLVAKGTMDEDVMQALEHKSSGQEALMQAVKARIDRYKQHH